MNKSKHRRIGRIMKIVLLSAVGLLIVISLSAYLLLHNYINKMNLVSSDETSREAEDKGSAGVSSADETAGAGEIELASIRDEALEEEETGKEEKNGASENTAAGDAAAESNSAADGSARDGGMGVNNIGISSMGRGVTAPGGEDTETQKSSADEPELMEDRDVMNILLIGSDTRSEEENGRSDSMTLLTMNKKTGKIITTSFLRDIYLPIPGKGENRLNAAFSLGGAELLLKTLQQNFRIKIDKYIMADFFTFINIVDTIGGITLEVREDDLDTINGYIRDINDILGEAAEADILKESGYVLLNGKQALGYSRNRYTSRGDFDRTDKQREVLITIYEKVKKLNFIELNGFLNTILPQITTNFKENEILAQLFTISAYFQYDLEQWSVPMQGTYVGRRIDGMQVLEIDFEENIAELYKRLYDID